MAKQVVIYPFNIIPLSNERKELLYPQQIGINLKIIVLSERIQPLPAPKIHTMWFCLYKILQKIEVNLGMMVWGRCGREKLKRYEETFGGDIIARCLDYDDGFLGVCCCCC